MIRNDGLLKDMKKVMDVQGLPPQKTLWTTPPFGYYKDSLCAQIAQPVEQRTENPCVGGSNPSLGTRNFWAVVNFIFLVGVAITTLRKAEIV